MKNECILLSPKVKFVGLALIVIGVVFGICVGDDANWLKMKIPAFVSEGFGNTKFFTMIEANLKFTITGILLILGGLLMAFSREKIEDEFVNHLRLKAFQYAVIINYFVLFLCFLLVWNTSFITVLVVNLYSTLFLFIVIFRHLLLKNKDCRKNEE
jgi:hypothetical protein